MINRPNFFILGALKCGTTSLYYHLAKHPQVLLSSPKEPFFFEYEYALGPDYYWRTYFASGWQGQPLVGEARVANLILPYVPARIFQLCPDARLIVILRNPIERAFSHWWMTRCNGREKLDFDQAIMENHTRIEHGITTESEDAERIWRAHVSPNLNSRGFRTSRLQLYLEAGYYALQLERYFRYFPRSQVCVLFYDDFCQTPLGVLRELFAFLGLDPAEVKKPPARENMGLTNFSQPFYVLSHYLRLHRILPRKMLSVVRNILSNIGQRPTMQAETRQWLRQHYEPHNRQLETLLERDLSAWSS